MKREQYVPSPVPRMLGGNLLDWLRREFQSVRRGFQGVWDMPISTEPPEKVRDGMLRFADGTVWDPGGGRGVYVYVSGAWVKL